MIREGAVQAQVLAYLTRRGDMELWRQNTGGMKTATGFVKFGVKGAADIFCILAPSGRFVGVECKRPIGGVLSDAQKAWGAKIERAGGLYIVAKSVAEVIAALPPVTYQIPSILVST